MLKLRRGTVVGEEPLTVDVSGERRPAWADATLVGEVHEGDEVVVNVEALDLGLGSGGFDVVHVNLTRGLDGPGAGGAHVMKLGYTSLQHPIEPVERSEEEVASGVRLAPVLAIPLHGHLAPAAWAASAVDAELRVGYIQTGGGALPGALSRDVAELRRRGLLRGHICVAPAYGAEHEAISLNVPLPPGSGDDGYLLAFERIVVPTLRSFRPELILVSAGQDAAASDPLGRMSVTTEGFRRMTAAVKAVAGEACGGRLVAVQEGGYSADHMPYCVVAIVEALAGLPPRFERDPLEIDVPSSIRAWEADAVEAVASRWERGMTAIGGRP